MTKTQRFETIKQKLELMQDLWNEIQDLDPETLTKKQKEDLVNEGKEFSYDVDNFFMELEYES